MKIKWLLIILLLIFAATILALFSAVYLPYNSQESIVYIQPGASAANIAVLLDDNSIIRNKNIFLYYVKLFGIDKNLSHGEYHFPEKISMKDVVEKLILGRVVLHPVTIIEGLTIRQTAERLLESKLIDYDRFISLCKDSTFIREVTGLPLDTLEGFLYPDTYHFPKKASEEFIIRTMSEQLFRRVASLSENSADTLSVNQAVSNVIDDRFYETLILASIVEKEATFIDEMPLIAGVYHNRLQIGKRLQADPTVAYVLQKQGIHRSIIFYRDLEVESPYNTYRNRGLPPAPICSPSIYAIRAAMSPLSSEYLFFFADNRGRHIFTRTYAEHLRMQRELRSNTPDTY